RSLVTAIRPSGLSEDELGRIVERAAGNAFYAEELASAAGQDRQAGAGDGLPGELAELLLIRLDRLSELAGELVRLAAVAGGRIGHEQLVELADRPDRPDRAGAAAELEAALREAVDEHVLEPVDIGYTFRHALLSEAVYDDLLPGERVRLHAAFARLLAGQPGSANAAQLARHARRSNDLAGAFAASILAGEQAMDLAAPQEAMRHFETALELLGSVPAPADRDWTQLVLAAADAAGDAGHPYRALAIVRDALERPPVGLADLDHARLLLGLANRSLLVDADNDAAAATTAALQLVPAQPPSQLRARLAALHAHASVALGRDVDGARWAQEAIELSGQLGQPEAAADARTTLGLIERRSGDPDAAAQQLRAVAEQAQAGGELTIELRSRYTLATLHHEQGQLPAALVAFQTAANRARETGRQWAAYGIEARALAGMVQYELGDWDGALRTVDVAGQAAPATAAGLLTAVGLAVRAGRGETEALSLLPMLRQRWQSEGLVGALAAGPAIELLAGTGDSAGALALLDEHLECQTRLWQNEWFLGRIRISALGLATLSVQAATSPTEQRAAIAERGAELADAGRLSASRGLPAGRRLGIEAVGWLARLEAEAARLRWLTGVQPPALADHIELWQASVAGFGYGHGYEQARSRTRLAELLRAAGKAEEAAAQAELARTLGRRLGAEPLLAEL
ncbi:MAG: helix-turn-helix transcriptional regulator, partial [Jatrophihabitantaceae bacterium]